VSLVQRLARTFLEDHPSEAARALERMPVERRLAIVRSADAASARALVRMLPAALAECLADLEPAESATVLASLPLDALVASLRRLPADATARLVEGLPANTRETVTRILRHPENTAAALMDPGVLSLPDDITAGEARVRLRRDAAGLLHYLFVVDRSGRLVGVLDIPELLRARGAESVRAVMHEGVEHLSTWMPAGMVRTHPGWRRVHALPVTDDEGRLVGAIRYQTLRRLELEAEAGQGRDRTTATVSALGELFHLGLAGIIEGVTAAAAPRRDPRGRAPDAEGSQQ
jgi:Mg/Co/Ni transporter MgtE